MNKLLDDHFTDLPIKPDFSGSALGYIDHADGGAFVTAQDMAKLWNALLAHRLLDEEMTSRLLTPHVKVNDKGVHYGYGLWIQLDANRHVFKYHVMGYDPGVSFHSAYYPATDIVSVVCSNESDGAFDLMKVIEQKAGVSS